MLVGLEPEDRTVVVDEIVLGIELADEVLRLGGGLRERPPEDAMFCVGSLLEGENQVLAVVGDGGLGPPVLVLDVFPDERVSRLRHANLMIIELLVVIGATEVGASLRFGKAAVEEPLAVGCPLGPRELDPFQMVVQVLAGRDIADSPFVPVRARGGDAVSEQLAVLADSRTGKGDRPIRREQVGVKEQARGRVEQVDREEHGLVLQASVMRVEVMPAFDMGRREFFIVP